MSQPGTPSPDTPPPDARPPAPGSPAVAPAALRLAIGHGATRLVACAIILLDLPSVESSELP